MTEAWKAVDQLLEIPHYVIDFAVTPQRVYIVELNHCEYLSFCYSSKGGTTASSSLFDWKKDWDVLHNGPFDFRILREPPSDVREMIARPLRELIGWDETLSEPSGFQLPWKRKPKMKFKEITSAY